ncbi:cysteine three histidine 1 [Dunckerocampus dactyliophorus]|uniref:cysteine three histidine 1 n=1 Tax=Dunckerocampus dactyliophorus TaxID=161453 RepID=UPI002406D502|nr:cysteine three histidine 1 [Dunckerocampus dactyliophorus]
MTEASSDDLFLPACHDEELVHNLLSSEEPDGGENLSLVKALLPVLDSPFPLIPWVCSTRYKTELCSRYASSGVCQYAERCQFAHGIHDLRVPSRHPKYKTELCRTFHTAGHCCYGSRCLFVHGPTEQRPAPRGRRNIPCRNYRTFGVCPYGTRCSFLHVEDYEASRSASESTDGSDKTQVHQPGREWKPRGALCRTFSSFGFCLYGTRCHFQHGLPNKVRSSKHNLSSQLSPGSAGLSSPTSPFALSSSSTQSSPSSTSPLATPPAEATAHNAFTFSSQHLSNLLLPLALHLQQLEGNKAHDVWDKCD